MTTLTLDRTRYPMKPWPDARTCGLVLLGLIYGVGLPWACGLLPAWGRWYSASLPHRQQVETRLHGRLKLSASPAHLAHDLCWSEGGVHQVWGLGVPLWRAP